MDYCKDDFTFFLDKREKYEQQENYGNYNHYLSGCMLAFGGNHNGNYDIFINNNCNKQNYNNNYSYTNFDKYSFNTNCNRKIGKQKILVTEMEIYSVKLN